MNLTPPDSSWRALAVGSFVTLVLVVVAWNAAAYAIDASALEGDEEGWGVLFGSAIASVIYGGLPLVLSLVAVLVAGFGSPGKARAAAWCIAVLSLLCAVGLVAVGLLTVGGKPAETAFAAVSFVLALVLAAPLVLCIRRSRSARPAVAGAVPVA